MRYLNAWIGRLRWQWLKLLEKLDGIFNYCRTKVPLGVVEAVNCKLKALLRRGTDDGNLPSLLLKAQRLATTKTHSSLFRTSRRWSLLLILVKRLNSDAPLLQDSYSNQATAPRSSCGISNSTLPLTVLPFTTDSVPRNGSR